MNLPARRHLEPGERATGGIMAQDDGKAQMGEAPINVTVWYDYI